MFVPHEEAESIIGDFPTHFLFQILFWVTSPCLPLNRKRIVVRAEAQQPVHDAGLSASALRLSDRLQSSPWDGICSGPRAGDPDEDSGGLRPHVRVPYTLSGENMAEYLQSRMQKTTVQMKRLIIITNTYYNYTT